MPSFRSCGVGYFLRSLGRSVSRAFCRIFGLHMVECYRLTEHQITGEYCMFIGPYNKYNGDMALTINGTKK